MLSTPPSLLVSSFEPFVTRIYHEMEQTFKKFVNDFEALHRSAIIGSSNKFFVDPEEKKAVSLYLSKLRKDNNDTNLLSKISTFALHKAKCLWEDVYGDSIFNAFISYCCQLFEIPKGRFSTFPTNFKLSDLPDTIKLPLYQPSDISKELRHKDATAKGQVSVIFSHTTFVHSPDDMSIHFL